MTHARSRSATSMFASTIDISHHPFLKDYRPLNLVGKDTSAEGRTAELAGGSGSGSVRRGGPFQGSDDPGCQWSADGRDTSRGGSARAISVLVPTRRGCCPWPWKSPHWVFAALFSRRVGFLLGRRQGAGEVRDAMEASGRRSACIGSCCSTWLFASSVLSGGCSFRPVAGPATRLRTQKRQRSPVCVWGT